MEKAEAANLAVPPKLAFCVHVPWALERPAVARNRRVISTIFFIFLCIFELQNYENFGNGKLFNFLSRCFFVFLHRNKIVLFKSI